MNMVKEVTARIRSGYPCIWINTLEEDRVRELLSKVASHLSGNGSPRYVFEWSIATGLQRREDNEWVKHRKGPETCDPKFPVMEENWRDYEMNGAIIWLKDYHRFLHESNPPVIKRRLREFCAVARTTRLSVIITSPETLIPPELAADITVLDLPLPNRTLLSAYVLDIVEQTNHSAIENGYELFATPEGDELEAIVNCLTGLTTEEACNILTFSLVMYRQFDLSVLMQGKVEALARTGFLEYYPPSKSWNDVGGLDLFKEYLKERRNAFSDKAREFGLPIPKGVLVVGVYGVGKSLMAKATGAAWGFPVLRLDIAKCLGSRVGQSESQLRYAIKVAEAAAPCILWVDEMDKAFAGSASSDKTDGGVSKRLLGTMAVWLQEKKSHVYVISTANSVDNLPPELLRAQRFDEIFGVDLPSSKERAEIYKIHISRFRPVEEFDLFTLSRMTDGFSGAEIENTVTAGLYTAFSQGTDFCMHDIFSAIQTTTTMSVSKQEEVAVIREWIRDKARPVSSAQIESRVTAPTSKRKVELRKNVDPDPQLN